MKSRLGLWLTSLPIVLLSSHAQAVDKVLGRAVDKQLGLNISATETMTRVTDFHTLLLYIIIAITLFVFALLLWVMVRYSHRANSTPSNVSHNTLIEVIWTVVPIIILVVIAIPSFKLLYHQDETPTADMVIKATGHQWYWTYEYPDFESITFDSIMMPAAYWEDQSAETRAKRDDAVSFLKDFLVTEQEPQIHRLLDTDTRIVVPVNTTVKVHVTASDVMHSWTIPSFGIKQDAVPGRLNETWFRADKTGTFYGQCSELCGVQHAFMPIVVEVVTQEQFDRWVAKARQEYAQAPIEAPVQTAQTDLTTGQ